MEFIGCLFLWYINSLKRQIIYILHRYRCNVFVMQMGSTTEDIMVVLRYLTYLSIGCAVQFSYLPRYIKNKQKTTKN